MCQQDAASAVELPDGPLWWLLFNLYVHLLMTPTAWLMQLD